MHCKASDGRRLNKSDSRLLPSENREKRKVFCTLHLACGCTANKQIRVACVLCDCVVVFCSVQRSSRVVLCYHIVSRHCNHSAFQNLEAPPCLQLPASSDSDAVTSLGMSSGPKKVAFSSALFIENSCLMDTLPRTSF